MTEADLDKILDIMDMLGYIRGKDARVFSMVVNLVKILLQNNINLLDTGTIREKRGSGT